ncbi:MAG: hypothetical protein RBJ76_28710 [Stenomitos frigidus ULC029]
MSPIRIESGKPKGRAQLTLFYLTQNSLPSGAGIAQAIAGHWSEESSPN